MEIKITGAEKSTYWYAGLVGKTFKVIRRAGDEHGYKVAHHDPADPPETGYYVGESDCVIVSEVPANITVLKDESLGGIEREYREVKRKAAVGERIKIVKAEHTGRRYKNGDILTVDESQAQENGFSEHVVVRRHSAVRSVILTREYVTLEPTDIIRIDSVRFRMVDRKATVGERVIVVNPEHDADEFGGYKIGDTAVITAEKTDSYGLFYLADTSADKEIQLYAKEYRVLEPVESAEATEPLSTKPAPDQAAEIIAKLTTRVASLEKRVAALETPAEVTDEDVAEISRIALDPPVFSGVSKLSRVKSPQEIRDDIVKRAKEDVADLMAQNHPNSCVTLGVWLVTKGGAIVTDRVDFVVDRVKRTVVALVIDIGRKKVIGRGIAKCAPGDVFNVWIGRAIALRRALGLTVPAEYFEAPNPTEVRVGDIVRIVDNDGSHHYDIGDIGRVSNYVSSDEEYATIVGTKTKEVRRAHAGYLQHVLDADYVIIDDSRIGEAESDSAEPRKEVA